MGDLSLPKTDELIERHQFYATIAARVETNKKDIDGVAQKTKTFLTNFEAVRDEVKTTATRNRTLITVAVVVWSLLGGGITLYIKRGIDTFDQATARVNALEKKSLYIDNFIESRKDLPNNVEAIKRSVNEHQRILDDLEMKMRK